MATLSQDDVARYLSQRLGALVTIRALKQTFPGVSRDTWLVQADVAGERQGFTIRIDPPEGPSGPCSLRQEYEIYARLHGSEVPVAQPLWFDEGIDFAAGRPHMVRRLVEGATSIPGLADRTNEAAALRKRVAFEVMEKLALVHRLDWQALRLDELFPAPASAAEALRADFELWRGYWDAKRPSADPVLEEALCWLSENIPADTPRISLVKGNNGVGEEIWRGDKIVALSDWELASLADGALDLGFSQGTMQLADFGEILRHYEQAVGSPVSPERLAFSGFLIWFKQVVCVEGYMLRHYLQKRNRRILGLSFGLVHAMGPRDRLAKCIGKNIVAAWRDVVASELSLYSSFGGEKT